MEIKIINEKLEKLIKLDKDFSIFGSSSHEYIINPKLTEEEIQNFEEKNQITLPDEYREYLKNIGNGGAGPFYGLLELEDNDNVISCEYYRPHNAHYKEFLVTINNNGKIEEHIVCYKAM